jgi:hypothetical protein
MNPTRADVLEEPPEIPITENPVDDLFNSLL